MKKTKTRKNKTVSKSQWLAKALETLQSNGVEGVKIEQLARALGTSRSGFYWHFKNRQDLLKQMLEYWVNEYTNVVLEDVEFKKLDPEKRLLTLMDIIRDKSLAKYELAINAWAKIDPQARTALKKAVTNRLDFLRSTFAELGFSGDELEMRTRLFVCYHSWEDTMFSDLSSQKNIKLLKLRYEFFINS